MKGKLSFLPATGAIALIIISLMVAGCIQPGDPDMKGGPASSVLTPASPPSDQAGPIRTEYSPGEITRISDEATRTAQASLDAIITLPPEERTVNTTLVRFDEVMTDYRDATRPLILMGYVHTDTRIASEGMACEEAANSFISNTFMRHDIYDALKDQVPRNPGELRLFQVTIKQFEKNGLTLAEDRLDAVRSMRSELASLEGRFMANLNSDNTTVEFITNDLSGIPPETLSTFTKTDRGTYIVTTKTPDYSAVMSYADRSETRKRMQSVYYNRQGEENTQLLEEALMLRQQIAHELGYATWADYRLDGRMAGSTENVARFLEDLKGPLLEKSQSESAELLAIKKSLDPNATTVDSWDIAYLQNVQRERLYAFSDEEFREYFPMDQVLENMFAMYGPMFGVTCTEVKDVRVWAPDVRLYRVSNSTDGSTIGYLYLDLYPREGKFGHFTEFPLISGRMKNGTYSVPVTAILGNFRAPDGEKPSLLDLFELEALFHETGHTMHLLLTRAPYGTLSSAHVEMDFYETSPQTLSEWVFDPEVLELLSGHYTNRSQKIPKNLSSRAIIANNQGIGLLYCRQVALTTMDMAFHTMDGPINATEVSDQIYVNITGIPLVPGNHFPARFEHLMGGYDASYYGYLWSMVYAQDIVEKFKQDGMTNVTTGMKFRDDVLAPGNMEDGMALLERFLGREPDPRAFYRRLGITPGTRANSSFL